MMKKVSLALNIVLVIAVAVLFYLHFSPGKETGTSGQGQVVASIPDSISSQIAYINYDTLLMNYEFYHDLSAKLEKRQKELENELGSRSRSLERQMTDFQEKVQKQLMTRYEAKEKESQLMQEQQALMQYRDQLTNQLVEEEQVMNRKLIQNIRDYLKNYNKSKGYQVVISNTFGGPLLYADRYLDITHDVIVGINEEYMRTRNQED